MQLRYNLSLFLILILVFKTNSQNLEIFSSEKYSFKNLSIRAIEVVNDSTLWFAGSNGKYGRIINDKVQMDSIAKINGKNLNFRSIAFNGKSIFFLSIENPAILYKLNPFKKDISHPEIVYREEHDKVFYDSMNFFDELNGIAMGDPTDNCLSVILTVDGGNTWKKTPCKNLPKIEDGEAAFAASNTNIAIHKDNVWLVTGGKKSRIFYSHNKGNSWSVYNTPIIQGKEMTGIFTVDFYDELNGIVMGGNWEEKSNFEATKAITKNGGKTWELISNNKEPGYISCVQYIPQSRGKEIMAVSTEGIYYSNDKGANWKRISQKKYYTFKFIDKNNAWFAGDKIEKINFRKEPTLN